MRAVVVLVVLCAFSGMAQGPVLQNEQGTSRTAAANFPAFSFMFPEHAGTLYFGIGNAVKSRWFSSPSEIARTSFSAAYREKEGDAEIRFEALVLPQGQGFIVEVDVSKPLQDVDLFWGFGGASGKVQSRGAILDPGDCRDNVFSVERTSFTVYYGESMQLKVLQAVTPLSSTIRLSDAHQMTTPLAFFASGKQTDAPALAATIPLDRGGKLYFCFYKQSPVADFNYDMLPEVFANAKAAAAKNNE